MPRRSPRSPFRSTSRVSAHLPISADQGVTRDPRAFPEAQHDFRGLFPIIKKGRSRQGAFSALNLDYLGKPSVLGAKKCSDVLSQASGSAASGDIVIVHRVRARCTHSTLRRSTSSHTEGQGISTMQEQRQQPKPLSILQPPCCCI